MSLSIYYYWLITVIIIILNIFIFSGMKIIHKTHRGVVERFGKYKRFAEPGIYWIIPAVEKMKKIDITMHVIDTEPMQLITNDNIDIMIDVLIYYKIKEDKKSLLKFQYNGNMFYEWQIMGLARKTMIYLINKTSFQSLDTDKDAINEMLHQTLSGKTSNWGIDILKIDLTYEKIDIDDDAVLYINL
jgi:regulator of protease activity HflC (stomatin/prohibitin superfamily)